MTMSNDADTRARATADEVYRSEFRLPKGMELTDPRAVQAFIDDEYREATFDPKYGGGYDERLIAPGDPDELNDLIRREPWPDDRLIAAHAELDRDVQGRGHDRAGEWFAEFALLAMKVTVPGAHVILACRMF